MNLAKHGGAQRMRVELRAVADGNLSTHALPVLRVGIFDKDAEQSREAAVK
jgi:hypothetical protein